MRSRGDASRPAATISTATRPPRSSTRRARPALRKARCSRTTTSPPTPSISSPAGRSPIADRFLLALPLFHIHALGNGLHCWLAQRLPHAPAGALRSPHRRSTSFATSADALLRRADDVRAPARYAAGRSRARSARGCGSSSPAPRRCPRTCSNTSASCFGHTILERYGMTETFMNIEQSVHRRTPCRHGRLPAARRLGRASTTASCSSAARTSSPVTGAGPKRPRPRSSTAGSAPATSPLLRRRLLHAARPQERPDHLRRLQHLSARDRGVSARTAGRDGGRGGRRARTRCAAKCRSRIVVGDVDDATRSRKLAARSSRRSKCRAASCRSIRSRAPRSAKCRSTCCRGKNRSDPIKPPADGSRRSRRRWRCSTARSNRRNHRRSLSRSPTRGPCAMRADAPARGDA